MAVAAGPSIPFKPPPTAALSTHAPSSSHHDRPNVARPPHTGRPRASVFASKRPESWTRRAPRGPRCNSARRRAAHRAAPVASPHSSHPRSNRFLSRPRAPITGAPPALAASTLTSPLSRRGGLRLLYGGPCSIRAALGARAVSSSTGPSVRVCRFAGSAVGGLIRVRRGGGCRALRGPQASAGWVSDNVRRCASAR